MMNTEKDYAAAADGAENYMTLKEHSTTALRGQEAADYGRAVLAAALGATGCLLKAPGQPALNPYADLVSIPGPAKLGCPKA